MKTTIMKCISFFTVRADKKMKNRSPFFCLHSFYRPLFIALLFAPLAALHADDTAGSRYQAET
jgi:hypothetical protein